MTYILEIILLSLILLVCFIVYAFLMSGILPRFVLRVSYNVKPILGRGLKKFTYPEGRGVLYESQPSVRKYVERYALFTLDGFKYIQLMLGAGVENYTANVVMINNRNKVIGLVEIAESTGGALKSRPVRLHDETSYVAISVSRVNGDGIAEAKYAYTKLLWMGAYFAAVSALSFALFWRMYYTADAIFRIFGRIMPASLGLSFFVVPSLFIGFAALAILIRGRMKKGIRVGVR